MANLRPTGNRWRAIGVGLAFWLYAITLLVTVRAASHHLLHGGSARLATMAGLALGLLPWAAWLRPRLVRALDLMGRAILIGCYLTLLALSAIATRLFGDPLRRRPAGGGSQWLPRRPLPNTLDAARLES